MQAILENTRSKQRRLTFNTQLRQSIAEETNERILKVGLQIVGPVLRLFPSTHACLDRLVALYFLEAISTEQDGPAADGNNYGVVMPTSLNTAILTDLNRVRYPPYTVIRSRPVFACRSDWDTYNEALSYERTVRDTLANEDELEPALVESLLATTEERWKKSLSNHFPVSSEETNPSYFLHRYQAGWIYTRVLASLVPILERAKTHEKANRLLEILLSQDAYCKSQRGRWWERLVLNSQTHLREPVEKGLDLLRAALNDPHVRTSSRLNLTRRLAKLDLSQPAAISGEADPSQIITIYADPEDRRQTGKKLLYLLPGDALGSVEQLAMAHFAAKGWLGFHCENRLYQMLFGLLLWDAIFANVPDVFQTPHQMAPLDLGTETFYSTRKQVIDRRLQEIGKDGSEDAEAQGPKGKTAAQILTHAYHAYYGCQALGMVWEEYPLAVLLDVCHSLGGQVLEVLMRHLAEDYAGHCCGLPDLLLYRPDRSDYLLVEVKSSNDRMSDAQRCWHIIFQEQGIKFTLFRVLDTIREDQEIRKSRRIRGPKAS